MNGGQNTIQELSRDSSVKDAKENIYILNDKIGEGGFGSVFKVYRESDGALFAVKTMPLFSANTDDMIEFKKAFNNEVQTAMKVHGENVIRYVYVHAGDIFIDLPPYIIMEYADGGTLHDLLNERKKKQQFFDGNELIVIFRQLVNGMKAINKTLVHRDIKPHNILICNNFFKISDFGLSKMVTENTRSSSKTFKGYGTERYMAPEAWDSNNKNTIQMDIYSMGIVFFELATLQYPYSNVQDYKDAHINVTIADPEKLNPALPPSLASLIRRMLEKPLQKRFTNWDDILCCIDNQVNPQSKLDDIVSKALSIKNATDLSRQRLINEANQKANERAEHWNRVIAQFKRDIISPISEFVDKYNKKYPYNDKYSITEDWMGPLFILELHAPDKQEIIFRTEIIQKENYLGTIGDTIPQCKNRDILLWSQVFNRDKRGFNLLLLKNDGLYGEWIILTNTNNVARYPRVEPFAFKLEELPKEIINIEDFHIYKTKIEEFTAELLLNWVIELSAYH